VKVGVTGFEPEEVSVMDNIRAMTHLVVIGDGRAKHVDLAHLGRFVGDPLEVV
jgi:hypothetical protein